MVPRRRCSKSSLDWTDPSGGPKSFAWDPRLSCRESWSQPESRQSAWVRPASLIVGVLFRLIRELRSFQPEVLQTFLFHANVLGRIAGKLAGVPRIYSGLRVAEKQKRWHMGLDRWTQWCVQMNVCVSEGVRLHAINRDSPLTSCA